MYKVLIVDDENVIRRGLKNIINWNSLDCVVCGEASDGVDGMNKIMELKPDLIITDINMPGIDGLSMIKKTKELIPDSKIIILTGYRNMEYLEEAIKIGAFDYILKPSKIEIITSTIKRGIKELNFIRNSEYEMNKLKKYFESKMPVLKERLLYDIMFNLNIIREEVLDELEFFHVTIKNYIVMIVETDMDIEDEVKNHNDRQLYQFGIINTFEEVFSECFEVESITLSSKQIAFIVQPRPTNDLELVAKSYDMAGNLQELIKNCFNFTVSIGISALGKDPFQLSERAREAMEALNYKFYLGKNSIIMYEDLKYFYKGTDPSLLENYQKLLIQYVKIGNIINVRIVLAEIFKNVNEVAIEKDIIKNYYFNILNLISNTPAEYRITDNEVEIPKPQYIFRLFNQCKSLLEMNTLLEEILVGTTLKIHGFNKKSINMILQKAIDFIQNNYQEAITLNEVSSKAFVSPFYLSRMFTKELDKNFVDYLSEIRIQKAKEFLKGTSHKTYEIAEMVGIKDSHYFSKIFKKYTGLTPSEYRIQKPSV